MRWLLAFLLMAAPVLADPVVSSVSGSSANADTLVITGSGFGTKPQAAPIAFETVEGGAFDAIWASTEDLTVSTDADGLRHSFSSYCAYDNYGSNNTEGVRAFFRSPTDGSTITALKWYLSYWFRLDDNWVWGTGASDHLSNVKFFRVLLNTPADNVTFTYFLGGATYTVEYVNGDQGSLVYDPDDLIDDGWHHFQVEYFENSASDEQDGGFTVWIDGREEVSVSNIATYDDGDHAKSLYMAGFTNTSAGTVGQPADNHLYFDDVVCDTVFSRVEIGDAAVYDSCTVREYQPAFSWATDAISVVVNQASFSDAATAYLFVVDGDGVASSGYQLTVGEEIAGLAISTATADGSTVEVTWNDTGASVYQLIVADQGDEIFHYAGADTSVEFPYAASDALDVRVRADGGGWVRTGIAAQ